VLFSPESIKPANAFEGALGRILEADLSQPDLPFFYLCSLDMPGREMYEVKYGNIPLPGMRILEWKQGIEMIAIKTGDTIHNTFVESDADLIVALRDTSMKAVFIDGERQLPAVQVFADTTRVYFISQHKKPSCHGGLVSTPSIYTTAPRVVKAVFTPPAHLVSNAPVLWYNTAKKGNRQSCWDTNPSASGYPDILFHPSI
jgi:hypothetical protein